MSVLEALSVDQPRRLVCAVGPPSIEDRLLARLVDGRTIHFHLQFVEPLIAGRSRSRPAARANAPSAEALGVLAEVGLEFFVELAGAVVPGEIDDSAPALAATLVRAAAEELIRQWMEVTEGRDLTPALDELISEFGSAVVHEFVRRWEGEPRVAAPPMSFPPSGVLDWLDRLPGAVLAKELFCCWYPHWHRSAFIVDSPLDHLVELPPPGTERRCFSEALELHRRGLIDGTGT